MPIFFLAVKLNSLRINCLLEPYIFYNYFILPFYSRLSIWKSQFSLIFLQCRKHRISCRRHRYLIFRNTTLMDEVKIPCLGLFRQDYVHLLIFHVFSLYKYSGLLISVRRADV